MPCSIGLELLSNFSQSILMKPISCVCFDWEWSPFDMDMLNQAGSFSDAFSVIPNMDLMSDSDAMFIYWAIWGFCPQPFSLPSLSSMNLDAARAFFSSDECRIPLIVDSASSIRLFLASNIRSLNPNLSMAFHNCFGEHFRYAHMSNVRPEYLSIASSSIFYASFSFLLAFSMCWCFFSYSLMSDGVIGYSVVIFGFMVVSILPFRIIPHLQSPFCGLVVHHLQLMLHHLVLQIDVSVMLSENHYEGCPYRSCYVAKCVGGFFNVELVDCLHAAYKGIWQHVLL